MPFVDRVVVQRFWVEHIPTQEELEDNGYDTSRYLEEPHGKFQGTVATEDRLHTVPSWHGNEDGPYPVIKQAVLNYGDEDEA